MSIYQNNFAPKHWDRAHANGHCQALHGLDEEHELGIRYMNGAAIVPMRAVGGALLNIQKLFRDPKTGKTRSQSLRGHPKDGTCHILGSAINGEDIYVAESFLEAATIWRGCRGKHCVITVFSQSQLRRTVLELRKRYRKSRVLVVPNSYTKSRDVFPRKSSHVLMLRVRGSNGEPSTPFRVFRKQGIQAAWRQVRLARDMVNRHRSYFIDYFKVTQAEFDMIEKYVAKLATAEKRFMRHMIASTIIKFRRTGHVSKIPIPYRTIEREARGCNIDDLRRKYGLIAYDPEGEGVCRKYFLTGTLATDIMVLATKKAVQTSGGPYRNLMTGKPTVKILRNRYTDRQGCSEPKLISRAMRMIQPRQFQPAEMRRVLARYNEEIRDLVEMLEINDPGDWMDVLMRGQLERVTARYRSDYACYRVIMMQNPKPIDVWGGIWSYQAAYAVQRTGRIGERRGGLQNASKEMKNAAYAGIPGIRNYDLKASQLNGLVQQFDAAGITSEWLNHFRSDLQNIRVMYAEEMGVDVGAWKNCFYSIVMGGILGNENTENQKARGSAYNVIMNYFNRKDEKFWEQQAEIENVNTLESKKIFQFYWDLVNRSYRVFREQITPFVQDLDRWHEWIIGEWMGKDRKKGTYRYREMYLTNAAGKKAVIGTIQDEGYIKTSVHRKTARRRLAAHILQGQEAAYIHHLTLLSLEYGFKVIGNEHDGLITIGEIPAEAQERAGTLSGLSYPVLEEKPFKKDIRVQ